MEKSGAGYTRLFAGVCLLRVSRDFLASSHRPHASNVLHLVFFHVVSVIMPASYEVTADSLTTVTALSSESLPGFTADATRVGSERIRDRSTSGVLFFPRG